MERKRHLAFSPVTDGMLTYTASGGADTLQVSYHALTNRIIVNDDGAESSVSAVGVTLLDVDAAGGADNIEIGQIGDDFPIDVQIRAGSGVNTVVAATPVVATHALTIYGGEQADHINFTTAGTAYVYAGGGADAIVYDGSAGPSAFALIRGGAGADTITARSGALIYPDGGRDTVYGSTQADIIHTSGGVLEPDADLVYAAGGDDQVFAGHDNDTIYGQGGRDYLILQADDTPFDDHFHGFVTLDGGDDADFLQTGDNNDPALLRGGAGADTLDGLDQLAPGLADTLLGGPGNDTLFTSGSDSLSGEAGDDTVMASVPDVTAPMTLKGGSGNDTILGGVGNDTLDGGSGIDSISGNSGDDVITAQLNNGGSIHGNAGNDTITAYSGSTLPGQVFAGARLFGDRGNDRITGTPGNDTLDGGLGDDSLLGVNGNDRYTFADAAFIEADKVSEKAGGGTDTLDFGSLSGAVIGRLNSSNLADMTNRTVRLLTAGEFVYFENLTGGSANDILTGNGSTNRLLGNAGRDRFFAAGDFGKKDTLNGGADDDLLGSTDADDILISVP